MIFYEFKQLSNKKGDGPMYKQINSYRGATNTTKNELQGNITSSRDYIKGSIATKRFQKQYLLEGLGVPIEKSEWNVSIIVSPFLT